jgi:hypothetical protein
LKSSVIKSAVDKPVKKTKVPAKKPSSVSAKGLVINGVTGKLKTSSKTTKKSNPVKPGKKVKLIKK